jgi:hypothetical protein
LIDFIQSSPPTCTGFEPFQLLINLHQAVSEG